MASSKRGPPSLGMIKHKYIMAVHNKKTEKALNIAMSRLNQFPALVYALEHNCRTLCGALITMGWDVNEVRPSDGATPLHTAATLGNFGLLNRLLARGAVVNRKDASGNTPLGRFLKGKQEGLVVNVYGLLASEMTGEFIRAKNDFGETLLHVVAKNRSVPFLIYERLMTAGVGVGERDDFTGRNFVMDMMIFNGNDEMIIAIWQEAVSRGLNLNQKDNYGCTILHSIAAAERKGVMEYASKVEGLKVRVENLNSLTPMWIACKRGNMEMVKMLYKMGESLKIKAYLRWSSGQTPYDIASTNGHAELASLIRVNTEGERVDGKRQVRSLKWCAKETIREQIAKGGTNIWPKILSLELPKTLKEYLGELC